MYGLRAASGYLRMSTHALQQEAERMLHERLYASDAMARFMLFLSWCIFFKNES